MTQAAKLRRALAVIEERTDVHDGWVDVTISRAYGECSCGWESEPIFDGGVLGRMRAAKLVAEHVGAGDMFTYLYRDAPC